MISAVKLAWCAAYGYVSKGSVASLRSQGARVMVTELDLICASQGGHVTLSDGKDDEAASSSPPHRLLTGAAKAVGPGGVAGGAHRNRRSLQRQRLASVAVRPKVQLNNARSVPRV